MGAAFGCQVGTLVCKMKSPDLDSACLDYTSRVLSSFPIGESEMQWVIKQVLNLLLNGGNSPPY